MVFTVEPGIYVEGLGGVRIEDTVLVTAPGASASRASPRSSGRRLKRAAGAAAPLRAPTALLYHGLLLCNQ